MTNKPTLTIKRRTFVVMLLVGLYDVLLLGRLTDIQGLQAASLKERADQIHFRGVPLAPFRGNIVDRNGHLLAGSHHAYSVYAIPVQTRKHRTQETILLSTLLQLSPQTVKRRLSRRQGFVWIKRRIAPTELDALRSQLAALPGVHLITETARYYPQGELAGPVLGFTGIDNQGLAGIELIYDKYLTGKPGSIQEEFDVTGQSVAFAQTRVIPSVQGDTVELSLDDHIQWMAERACEQAMIHTQGKSVSIVVMHPKTGGILAMAQRPSMNPNHFRDYSPKNYRVLSVSDAIPPGSIFKPVTLAAALEEGTASVNSQFFCPGFKNVLGRRVNCWRPQGHGAENLALVVRNSCNVGFMELGLGLGVDKFYEYLDKFGLKGRTHIDLPGEALGIFPAMKRVTALDLAIMAFGQTLTVTPIALLNAISAIANDGVLLKPHIVRRILAPNGHVIKEMDAQVVRRVVSENVAKTVQSMMVGVVSEGTGKLAQVPGYKIAGKTGTAQKVINGRTEKGVYIASFIGFGPVPNPEVAVIVNVDEPVGAFYGGQVAAPIFGQLVRNIFRYLKLPPTEPIKPPPKGEPAMVPSLVNLDPETALQDAAAFGFPVQFEGRGRVVVDQSIEYGGYRPAGTILQLKLGDASRIYLEWVAVPQFEGLNAQSAARLAWVLGINVKARNKGSGVVRRQNPPKGTEVRAGSVVEIWLG
ncbi:penicillin-binding transpeptidase domain-containing protein [Sulfobacillus sp. hq2]|uniref:penicillin-binding transpeptidase domain-containing protein n=1 Tax=Sulfobacillus TaxID=28033 RepID=UPI000CD0634E|nr:penicillin-binding transpeptidase domain-containing protein [Sulfobacillus sp. hq2]POB09349.1 peptidoglycan glycosyltransferase [Sulfobacillus sp. hq2]